ncbi:prepilin-type N-terminal cleavage/methylation domain-containing protein [Massilia sp. CCM 8733]|uniref:Prepilin-type N-terminal cleavage/methylation domain-containing protein n=1 Tax=Massilia mucilaginosa TaxID=2609282 RepID=A0ABX0NWH1_9BURK|nr:type IV pilin protein [Massilia mucilaginosa]NHZ91326.1 prepilin-type N-terminal cleavage/methylation domain-containing protein [Massilia mucilaginosa]
MMAGARTMPGRRRSGGFTLIELFIACAVVGILSAIAYPSYTQYVLNSHRSTAKAILSEQAQYMERFYTSKGTYEAAPVLAAQSPKTGDARYVISIKAQTADAFTLLATPQGKQLDDKCGALMLEHTGTTSTEKVADKCW